MGFFGFGTPNVERLRRRKDVLGLLKALGCQQWEVRRAAVEALGEVGDGRAVDALIVAMKDVDTQKAAVQALGRIKDSRASESVIAVFKEGRNQELRAIAILSLAHDPGPRTVEIALLALADKDYGVYTAAHKALVTMGAHVVRPLVDGIRGGTLNRKGGNDYAEYLAAKVLGEIGGQAVEPLLEALRRVDAPWPIVTALELTKDPRVEPALVAALRDQHREPSVRGAIAASLGKLGDRRAIDALVESLADPQWTVWTESAVALNALGWKPASDGQRARVAVALKEWKAIAGIGRVAIAALLETLEHANEDDREAAIGVLGELGDALAVDKLLASIRGDKYVRVRIAAAAALGRIRDRRAVDPLASLLSSGELPVAAAEALGMIGDQRAIGPLVQALSHSELQVRTAAAHALGRTGDAQLVRVLVSLSADGVMAEVAITALTNVLSREGAKTSEEDLRAVIDLGDLEAIQYKCNDGCSIVYSVKHRVDCAPVKQLARQELVRRGLVA